MRHMRADVHQRDVLVAPARRQRRRNQLERLLHRVGLDIHHPRLQAGGLRDRDPILDLFLAGGRDQHLGLLGIVGRRADGLEVEIDLVERERDVLVGLGLDQQFQLFLPLPGRNDDLLGDDHRGRKGERDVLVPAAEPLVGALEGVRDQVQVGDVAVGDDVAHQGLDRIALEPIRALSRLDELDELDGGRTDVDPYQRRVLRLERVKYGIQFSSEHGCLGPQC